MKIKLLALVLLFNSIFVFSQDKLENSNSGKRISITNPSETIIKKILESGIDLRCGANHTHEELKLDLTYAEIKQLDKANIKYNIEIEDITKFYSERAKRDMPNAQSLLKIEKAKSKTLNKSIT
ncbi:MAG: hypothetical protein HKP59_07155, partial [Lutibacter sp.]|uniref:hypothetical protein n=1 Tax=Lutibacter sp. TaxID=1925666 RepID=UPI0017C766C0